MSEVTAISNNTIILTGNPLTMQFSAPSRSQVSIIHSSADIASSHLELMKSDLQPPIGLVVDRLHTIYFRSRFAYEFVQKVHRRQMIFFWRKKKYGLHELRASLKENIVYFSKYEEIAVEDHQYTCVLER